MQDQLDAFNARDLEAFITCYAPEIVIEGPDGAVMMRGQDEMRAMYGQLFAQSPELHCKVTRRIRLGAYAIDEEHTTGFVFAGFPTELHGVVVCRLEGGRIAHMRLLAAEREKSMSTEESVGVVRRYYDLLTGHPGDINSYDVVAPDAIFSRAGPRAAGARGFPQARCRFHNGIS